jgi:dihydrofolate synthase/folylpolyglutamate synthase
MSNKDHKEYVGFFKNISSITTIDIPNQPNGIKGRDLKKKLDKYINVRYKKSIEEALMSLDLEKDDLIMITGSLYLAGELLNLN